MRILKIVPGIFAAVGIALLLAAAWSYRSTQSFLDSALLAQGEVVELARQKSQSRNRSSTNRSSATYVPVVRFETDAGEIVEVITGVGSNPPSHRPGDSVQIYYLPDDPYSARINSFMDLHFMSVLLGGMGSLFFAVGGGILGYGYLRQARAKQLRRSGTRIEAKLTGVEKNRQVKAGGRSPFRITAQWQNPRTSEIHSFQSDNIWFDPTDYLGDRSIPVLIDRDDPAKYHVDTSFLPKAAD